MTDQKYIKKGDCVYTPSWVAQDMVSFFQPKGKILEPCFGQGSIFNFLPADSLFCEISLGKDFYDFNEKVDWIITNPPYSHCSNFIKHGITVSDNSVWLIPTWKMFSAEGIRLHMKKEKTNIKHIRHYGTGTKLGWSPLANAISAIHLQRDYFGDISQSEFNHVH